MTALPRLHRRHLLQSALSLPLLWTARSPLAQTTEPFPSRPIHIVVPHPAGGGMDVVVRKVSELAGEILGVPIVIENVPGASGNIGTGRVARAAPNGYTLVAINPTFSYVKYLFKDLPWKPEQQVVPITNLINTPDVLIVAGNSPYQSLQDLIDDARANPGKISFGTGGVGSPPHLAGEAFSQAAGVELLHVPYKGAAEVVIDILAGHVTTMITGIPSFTSHLKSGSIRALAIAAHDGQRSSTFPAIPTYTEAGLPALDRATSWVWYGLGAPSGTPPAVLDAIYQAFAQAQQSPEYQNYLSQQAALPGGASPAQLQAQANSEEQFWHGVTQRAGIEPV